MLGKAMQERFDEVVEAGFEASVPRCFARTSADATKKFMARPMELSATQR